MRKPNLNIIMQALALAISIVCVSTEAAQAGSMDVAPAPLTIYTSPTSLPTATQGVSYTATLQAGGGTPGYEWSIVWNHLPEGLTLDPNTGIISGTPTQTGQIWLLVAVADQSVPLSLQWQYIRVNVQSAPVSINTGSLPAGVQGKSYSAIINVTGGTPGYNWTILSGTLPPGLTLASSTGVISGVTQTSGTYSVAVQVTDQSQPASIAKTTYSVTVAAPLTAVAPSLSAAVEDTAYAAQYTATGGTPAYIWSVSSGALPPGISLNASTGVVSGTPSASGTYNFSLAVTDSGSLAQQQLVASMIKVSPAVSASGPGTTWYVRADGGSRYSANNTSGQCDGKADAAYGGTGVNQHCAFGDYRYLYDDQSYGPHSWVISGGDTVIIDNTKQWRVGFDQGISPNDVWCRTQNGPFTCFNPTIPAGTASQHTRILGRNYAHCSNGNVADPTQMTQLFGGYGAYMVINLQGAQYVDVQCLELTRHSQCVVHGNPVYPSGCSSSYPLDDYDSDGIDTDTGTHDVLLQDMWIHGHTNRGIKGPIGGVMTALRTTISYNGMAGWDFDDGNATPLVNAQWNFLYSTIEWNGCNQEYPIVDKFPAISCYSQGSGGYGDGVGTPAGTGLSANIDHSIFRYNTQDGLDLGHVDTGTPYTLSITNSLAYANNGGQFKWGADFKTVSFYNNEAIGNCFRMSAPITGAPASYNAHLGDFCRANDTISFNLQNGNNTTLANNTFVSYSPTMFDMGCGTTGVCGQNSFVFKNNIVLGYSDPATWNSGGQPGGPGGFYYQVSGVNTIRSNNIFYGVRGSCPAIGSSESCADPLLVNEPASFINESTLDNFNFTPSAGSPVIGAGIPLTDVLTDYSGATRPNPPSMGALE